MEREFIVKGMSCAACVNAVTQAVSALDGVSQVAINLVTGKMVVAMVDVSDAAVMSAVKGAGYSAVLVADTGAALLPDLETNTTMKETSIKREILASIGFVVALMYIAMGSMIGLPLPPFLSGLRNALTLALTQMFLTLPILLLHRSFFSKGLASLWRKKPTMDSLVAIGAGAAFLGGIVSLYRLSYAVSNGDLGMVQHEMHQLYFDSAAMIVIFVRVGKLLEERSKNKTNSAVAALLKLQPQNCLRFDAVTNTWQSTPVASVIVGDLVKTLAGERIATDGVVSQGTSTVNEAMLTGESLPQLKAVGDSVIAGTINLNGVLEYRTTSIGRDTVLAKIIQLVERATMSKAPISQIADRVAAIFVPVVMTIACLVFLIWLLVGMPFDFALNLAIAVLVISCPCALGLATPMAIMVGMGKGATRGLLIKSGSALELAGKIDTIILDKTGTVTTGQMAVVDIVPVADILPKELIKVATTVEQESAHPVALAIRQYAKEHNYVAAPIRQTQVVPGKGIVVQQETHTLTGGNYDFIAEKHNVSSELLALANQAATKGSSILYFCQDKNVLGFVAVADTLRQESVPTIRALKAMGLKVALLTGDHQATAKAIADEAGVDEVYANIRPEGKAAIVAAKQATGCKVAMVGDGVNDAPALVTADIGIAVGAGADVALESADIVLQSSNPMDIVVVLVLSRKTLTNIKQNLFWAFIYNILGIPIASGLLFPTFGILLNPMIAAFAMSVSSLFVVGNALRLYRFKLPAATVHQAQPEQIREANMKANNSCELVIMGMACGHCAGQVHRALSAFADVEVTVSLEQGLAKICYPETYTVDQFTKAVEAAGYEVKEVRQND